jgi:hypothetical protein
MDTSSATAALPPLQLATKYEFESLWKGSTTKGNVLLREHGSAYTVLWTSDDDQMRSGVALQADGVLGSATLRFPRQYTKPSDVLGIGIYRIADGRLTGMKVEGDDLRGSTETLQGAPSLSGRYEITEGEPRIRADYVKITPTGASYLVAWIGQHPMPTGVGIVLGDKLVVAYSTSILPAAHLFCQSGGELKGVGATGAQPTLGHVTLTPAEPVIQSAGGSDACLTLVNSAD